MIKMDSSEFATVPNLEYELILPLVTSSYRLKIYQMTFLNLFKNVLDKLNLFDFL